MFCRLFRIPAKYVQSGQTQTPTRYYKILTSSKQEKRTLSEENSVSLHKDRNGPICLSPCNSDDDDDDDDDDSEFPSGTCVFV